MKDGGASNIWKLSCVIWTDDEMEAFFCCCFCPFGFPYTDSLVFEVYMHFYHLYIYVYGILYLHLHLWLSVDALIQSDLQKGLEVSINKLIPILVRKVTD